MRAPASPRGAVGTPAVGDRQRGAVERYRRAVEPAVRGVAGVVVTAVLFAAGAAAGARGGVAIASAWVTVAGMYCVANFRHCRETHCAVTDPGWTLAGVLGLVAAITPGTALSWYRENQAAAAFLVILAAGYSLERAVAARTGAPDATAGGTHAQDR